MFFLCLAVVDDGTMSFRYAIPFNRAHSVDAQSAIRFQQPSPGPPSSGTNRIRDLRQAISSRILGSRQSETRRSLADTLSRDPTNPQCVLLAAVKWDGPAKDSFTITGSTICIGNYEMKTQDPFSMHLTSGHSFVVDSATSLRYRQTDDAFVQGMGISPLQAWLNSYAAFPVRGSIPTDLTTIKVWMTIQMNENSIQRIGFPFHEMLFPNEDDFHNTLRCAQSPKNAGVRLQTFQENIYYLPEEVLTKQCGYFRSFLSQSWTGTRDNEKLPLVIFPQVAPFTTVPDVSKQVVYFFLRRGNFPGLKENCMELIVAADMLDFPELMEVAQVAAVNCISMDDVIKIIRFAWEFRADLLFRAALLYLKANYDEIWVHNEQDLEALGQLLSNSDFVKAFRMERTLPHTPVQLPDQ